MTASRNTGRTSDAAVPALRSMLMSNSKEKPKGAVFWLLGAIICFQFCYQLLMHRILNHEKESWDSCESADSISQQCQENRLFHSWQVETGVVADDDDHLQDLLSAEEEEKLVVPVNNTLQLETYDETIKVNETELTPWAKKLQSFQEGLEFREEELKAKHSNRTELTPWAKSLMTLQAGFESRELHKSDDSVKTAESHTTPWAQHLLDIMKQFDARKKELEARRNKHRSVSKPAPEKTLAERIAELGRQMCLEPHRIHRPVCKQFLTGKDAQPAKAETTHLRGTKPHAIQEATNAVDAALHSQSWNNMTQWSKDLVNLQENFEFRMRLRQARSTNKTEMELAQATILDERLKELAERRRSLEKAVLGQIQSLQALAEGGRSWEKSTEKQIFAFGQELCADPARRDYAACEQFRTKKEYEMPTPAYEDSIASATTEDINLNWSAMKAWKSLPRDGEVEVVGKDQLSQKRWSGRIPKVACITVLPSNVDVEAWLGFFVDNFRSQKYEGPTQLVLVYHHQDTNAAKLVKTFADGAYIMGAATRDTDFPSAMSFRYGAWLSDADVVARWDFDSWHHSERLAMQVRALALTKRPVSILPRWTVREMDGTHTETFDGLKSESTIVGEAKWMQELWFPELKGYSSSIRASQLVKVDMPELMTQDKALQGVVLAKSDA